MSYMAAAGAAAVGAVAVYSCAGGGGTGALPYSVGGGGLERAAAHKLANYPGYGKVRAAPNTILHTQIYACGFCGSGTVDRFPSRGRVYQALRGRFGLEAGYTQLNHGSFSHEW
jgi:hypothetical protein